MTHYNHYFMKGRDTITQQENIQVLTSNFDTTAHMHDFVELVYFIGGVGTHHIGDEQIPISNGNLCILNANTEHYYHIAPHNNKEVRVLNLIFFPAVLGPNFTSENFINEIYFTLYNERPEKNLNYIHLPKDPNKTIYSLLQIIKNELSLKEEHYLNITRQLLWSCLNIIFRENQVPRSRSTLSPYNIQILDQILDNLESIYPETVTIKDIAAEIGYSAVYFSSIFKEYTGLTFHKYLQKLRCEKAKEMLSLTDKSVTQICMDVGYLDPKQFFVLFKKHTGLTPLKYRQTIVEKMKK